MSDESLLEIVDAVTRAKSDMDSAGRGVSYYTRILAAAEARYAEKTSAFNQALANMRQVGGMTE